jgi:hypothetical protein
MIILSKYPGGLSAAELTRKLYGNNVTSKEVRAVTSRLYYYLKVGYVNRHTDRYTAIRYTVATLEERVTRLRGES